MLKVAGAIHKVSNRGEPQWSLVELPAPTAQGIELQSAKITSHEAIGYIVRTYDIGLEFERTASEFVDRWGFDPSWEDLRKGGRKNLVIRVETSQSCNALPKLLERNGLASGWEFRKAFTRDLVQFERHQSRRVELWETASRQLIRWMADGLLFAVGRLADFDGKYFTSEKLEVIDLKEVSLRNTRFLPITDGRGRSGILEYWLVRNYVSLFDDPFQEYHSKRPSWGEVAFERTELLSLLKQTGMLNENHFPDACDSPREGKAIPKRADKTPIFGRLVAGLLELQRSGERLDGTQKTLYPKLLKVLGMPMMTRGASFRSFQRALEVVRESQLDA